jgi:predicted Zn-dependent protease
MGGPEMAPQRSEHPGEAVALLDHGRVEGVRAAAVAAVAVVLTGCAIAQYKTGALAEAAATLEQVLAQAPESGTALLYGGLVALRQKQDELAAERLTRFRALEPDPRFGAQVERALTLVRTQPVSDEVRAFVATSIEDAARATLELRAAWSEAARAWAFPSYPVRCYPTRRGGLVCL